MIRSSLYVIKYFICCMLSLCLMLVMLFIAKMLLFYLKKKRIFLIVVLFCLQQTTSTMPPPTRSNSVSWKPLEASNMLSNGIATRKRSVLSMGENQLAGKRKAESPLKKATKRSAFGDLTNVSCIIYSFMPCI